MWLLSSPFPTAPSLGACGAATPSPAAPDRPLLLGPVTTFCSQILQELLLCARCHREKEEAVGTPPCVHSGGKGPSGNVLTLCQHRRPSRAHPGPVPGKGPVCAASPPRTGGRHAGSAEPRAAKPPSSFPGATSSVAAPGRPPGSPSVLSLLALSLCVSVWNKVQFTDNGGQLTQGHPSLSLEKALPGTCFLERGLLPLDCSLS